MKKRKTPLGDGNFISCLTLKVIHKFNMNKRKTSLGDGNLPVMYVIYMIFSSRVRFLNFNEKRKTPLGDGYL